MKRWKTCVFGCHYPVDMYTPGSGCLVVCGYSWVINTVFHRFVNTLRFVVFCRARGHVSGDERYSFIGS